MTKSKVISIANEKGGVGKTTTAINLAVGLARQGKSVIALDLDPLASLTMALGYKQPGAIDCTMRDIMFDIIEGNPLDLQKAILRHPENIDFIPSNENLAALELGLVNVMGRERVLKTCADQLRKDYQYIIIDCPPPIGNLTINALAASDSVLIPTQPQFLSAKGLEAILKSVSMVKQRKINPTLKMEGILMTMCDRRTNFSKELIKEIRGLYGQKIKVFESEIPISVRVTESSEKGKSIYAHDKSGKVATAYQKFTQEVLEVERQKSRPKAELVR